jgi:hypothetical protein
VDDPKRWGAEGGQPPAHLTHGKLLLGACWCISTLWSYKVIVYSLFLQYHCTTLAFRARPALKWLCVPMNLADSAGFLSNHLNVSLLCVPQVLQTQLSCTATIQNVSLLCQKSITSQSK